jgi:lipoprotein-anchoring transpeptidase ErfK/SrfK
MAPVFEPTQLDHATDHRGTHRAAHDFMRPRTLPFAAALVACVTLQFPVDVGAELARPNAKRHTTPRRAAPKKQAPAAAPLPCGDRLSFEVRLDRQGFSPGQIDGTSTKNFARALAAWQSAHKMTASGQPDCDTWKALGGDTADPTILTYTVTEGDVKGPFEKQIPRELPDQAKLPALAYRSAVEEIAERFHAAPSLIQKLNPGVTIAAGREIKVPAVAPFDADTKPPANDTKPADITVQVSREESALRATRADGTVVLFAPVTTGSEHDPLPAGDWKVTGVQWHPPFHYNPKLFWDAKSRDTAATIKPGPNNPVGIVWIDLNLEHYGLHGTPEPGTIGMTQSHGCVRLTNWDAARLAALVKPGTPVLFR